MEHKVCKGCVWNKYPECLGTKMSTGEYMNIDYLSPVFICGQKDIENITDFSIVKKSDLELRIEVLESKIILLEEVRK